MILTGDCLAILPTLAADSVDAIVTDPPYHLTTGGKKGGTGAASDNPNSPAGRARIGTGFMGQAWDGGDVAFLSETWAAMLRVAKPGAYLLAFGGTRTFHRMACAIEDAGWELRDTLGWIYGSGFPKSHNGEWGGTALKPAWEPIIMARKPLIGTVAANHAAHGTGGLNIDGCRIDGGSYTAEQMTPAGNGRWPANVLHDGSEEVLACFPNAPGQIADASTNASARKTQNVYGDMKRGNGREGEPSADSANDGDVGFAMRPGARRGDSGSAARFFYCSKASRSDRNEGCEGMEERPLLWSSGTQSPGTFQAEGTKRAATNNHPTVKPTTLMRWLVRLVTPTGGLVLDPFAGSGSTGRAAVLEGMRFVGIELNPEYVAIAQARIAAVQPGLALGTAA